MHKNMYDELAAWMEDKQNLFDFTLPEVEADFKLDSYIEEDLDEETQEMFGTKETVPKSKSQVKKEIAYNLNNFKNYLKSVLRENASGSKDETYYKIEWLGELMNLNSIDKKIIEIAYRGEFNKMIEALLEFLFDLHFDSRNVINHPGFLSLLLDIDETDFKKSMSKNSSLKMLKLIDTGRNGDDFEVSDMLKQIMNQPIGNKNELKQLLVGDPLHSKLKWNDFAYMEKEIQYLEQLVSHSIVHQKKGINILFYGIPGTGKTEFSQVLCNHLKIPLYRTDLEQSMI